MSEYDTDEFEQTSDAAAETEMAEEPTHGHHGTTTALVIVGLALVVAIIGVAAFFFYTQDQSKQDLIEIANEHMLVASTAVSEIDAQWEDFDQTGSDEASKAFAEGADSTAQLIATARGELEMSESAISQLPDSEFKTEFTLAISLMREALDAYEMLFSGLGDTMEISMTLARLGEQLDDAKVALNDAVDDIDSGDYRDGQEKATRAKTSYETVAERYRELAVEYPISEADKLAAIADKNAKQAEYAIEMGEQGRRGSVSEFNAYVEKYAGVNDEIRELPLPSWAADVTLLTAESSALLEEATSKRDEALAAYERALAAFEAGAY